MISTVKVPEPYCSAILHFRPRDVVDLPAATAYELFGRATARASVGRIAEARQDFEDSKFEIGKPAELELAFLTLDSAEQLDANFELIKQIISDPSSSLILHARAQHLYGITLSMLGQTDQAHIQFRQAQQSFNRCDCPLGSAYVQDSIGRMLWYCGRVEEAIYKFDLSLAIKAEHGDLYGTAMTIGNLGRTHLDCGRFESAIEFLKCDLRISQQIGDRRGIAVVQRDLGRAFEAMGDLESAIEQFEGCRSYSEKCNFYDLVFQSNCYLAQVHSERDLQLAIHHFKSAESQVDVCQDKLAAGTLSHTQGVILAVQERLKEAVPCLERAIDEFNRLQRATDEIQARIVLIKVLIRLRHYSQAYEIVRIAMSKAQNLGLHRFTAVLLSLASQIVQDSKESVASKSTFQRLLESQSELSDRFVHIAVLGDGAFGSVSRVFDIKHQREVAMKVLRVLHNYDSRVVLPAKISITTELRIGATLVHPGLAKVYELSKLVTGELFVLQEFIEGLPLTHVIENAIRPPAKVVVPIIRDLALALSSLHDAGVIHRDVKPANVIIKNCNKPVLIDFGIAHFVSNLNPSREICGTLA